MAQSILSFLLGPQCEVSDHGGNAASAAFTEEAPTPSGESADKTATMANRRDAGSRRQAGALWTVDNGRGQRAHHRRAGRDGDVLGIWKPVAAAGRALQRDVGDG